MSEENELIIFNLRGKILKLKKKDIPVEDWFIYNLINDTVNDENEIYINEDYNSFMSLFESIRYNYLIKFDDISLEYLLLLGEKWCVPDWLLVLIRSEINLIANKKDRVYRCLNCNIGFKQSENFKDSCTNHSGQYITHAKIFECCGTRSTGCKIGYHIYKL
jgi:hypothetical protein